MFARHVVNQLHNQYGFAYARTAEQPYFPPFHIRGDQVNDLNTGFKNFRGGVLVFQRGRIAVNGHLHGAFNVAFVILRLAQHVHQAAQTSFSYGHGKRPFGIYGLGTAL